jgi:hypothetical protein
VKLADRSSQTAPPPRLHLPFILLLCTTQRLSDVLAMSKGQIHEPDGRLTIELRRQKTGALIAIRAHRDLVPLLPARFADPAGGLLLVSSPCGLPWTRRNFSRTASAASFSGPGLSGWSKAA